MILALVHGADRPDLEVDHDGSAIFAVSECETADFDSEPEIDSVDLSLNEDERDIFIEDVTGVVALEEEYRSWCVDTQARDRERTAARYGVARVCSVVAPCSA